MAGKPPDAYKFKPGQSGNPKGRPKDVIKQDMKKLTVESYREIVELIISGNIEGLQAIIKDPTQPALKVAVAAGMATAIKKGDMETVEKLLERVIGKVPDVVRFTGAVAQADVTEKISQQTVRDLVAKFSSEF